MNRSQFECQQLCRLSLYWFIGLTPDYVLSGMSVLLSRTQSKYNGCWHGGRQTFFKIKRAILRNLYTLYTYVEGEATRKKRRKLRATRVKVDERSRKKCDHVATNCFEYFKVQHLCLGNHCIILVTYEKFKWQTINLATANMRSSPATSLNINPWDEEKKKKYYAQLCFAFYF